MDRLTDASRQALSDAKKLALNHASVGPFHLAIALFHQNTSGQILRQLKVKEGRITRLLKTQPKGTDPKYSEELDAVLKAARCIARKWSEEWNYCGGIYVGTDVLLYALAGNLSVSSAFGVSQPTILNTIKRYYGSQESA